MKPAALLCKKSWKTHPADTRLSHSVHRQHFNQSAAAVYVLYIIWLSQGLLECYPSLASGPDSASVNLLNLESTVQSTLSCWWNYCISLSLLPNTCSLSFRSLWRSVLERCLSRDLSPSPGCRCLIADGLDLDLCPPGISAYSPLLSLSFTLSLVFSLSHLSSRLCLLLFPLCVNGVLHCCLLLSVLWLWSCLLAA